MANQNWGSGAGANGATQRRRAVLLLVLVGVSLSGCARRLPGPDECHEFALAWVLGPRAASVRRVGATTAEAILERTTECLTTPYDRELVQCVTAGTGRQSCLASFETRHRLPASSER